MALNSFPCALCNKIILSVESIKLHYSRMLFFSLWKTTFFVRDIYDSLQYKSFSVSAKCIYCELMF